MNGTIGTTGHRDYTGAKIGMWLFLFTEFFLFFGPFLLYSVFRYRYPAEFAAASGALSLTAGAANTVILLTSSLTMALSVSALQKGSKRLSMILMAATVAAGLVFLVNKYFEWGGKISHGIYPGSSALAGQSGGEQVFWGLYFFMTGLHALHVIAGISVICVIMVMVFKDRVTGADHIRIENAGLYWHLVDVIWIYLFPLFYLARS